MNSELEKRASNTQLQRENRPVVSPAITLNENEDGYALEVYLPGVVEADLSLTVEDRTLMIEAVNSVTPPEGYELIREECPQVRYRGVFEIPERVDTSEVNAALKNGILRIDLPKHEEVKPRKIAVSSG